MSHQCLLRLTPYVIGVYYPQHPTSSTAKSATFWWLMGNRHQPTSQEKTKLILVEYTLDIAWHGYSSAFCGFGSVVCCEETGFQRPQPRLSGLRDWHSWGGGVLLCGHLFWLGESWRMQREHATDTWSTVHIQQVYVRHHMWIFYT